MPSPEPDNDLFDAVEHLREALCVIREQLRLYADLTVHERAFSITTRAETFSSAMSHLATQVEDAIEYAEALKRFIP